MEWRGKKHTCGLVLFPVFPQLMFLCDILWSCCCLSSCCRLRWAAAGGRGCVVGSWLILLLFFRKPALVCVAATFGRLSIWKKQRTSFTPRHERATLGAHPNSNSSGGSPDGGVPKCPLKKVTPPPRPAALCSRFISGCFNTPGVYSRLLSRRFPH